jgi:xanthine/CO dehydrogenase XdhC/CoxF family maturation factor
MNLNSLKELVNQAISENETDRAQPSWIATRAMQLADPSNLAPAIVRFAANLEFRQIARDELRKQFAPETADETPRQHPLFPGLQAMYPRHVTGDEEPEYVRPELLSAEDISWNIARMRTCADTLQRGADALKAWARSRGIAA